MTSRTKLKRKALDDVLGGMDFGTDESEGTSSPVCSPEAVPLTNRGGLVESSFSGLSEM